MEGTQNGDAREPQHHVSRHNFHTHAHTEHQTLGNDDLDPLVDCELALYR
jgi:hypothetical protein